MAAAMTVNGNGRDESKERLKTAMPLRMVVAAAIAAKATTVTAMAVTVTIPTYTIEIPLKSLLQARPRI
jgi:hypothetical protein